MTYIGDLLTTLVYTKHIPEVLKPGENRSCFILLILIKSLFTNYFFVFLFRYVLLLCKNPKKTFRCVPAICTVIYSIERAYRSSFCQAQFSRKVSGKNVWRGVALTVVNREGWVWFQVKRCEFCVAGEMCPEKVLINLVVLCCRCCTVCLCLKNRVIVINSNDNDNEY